MLAGAVDSTSASTVSARDPCAKLPTSLPPLLAAHSSPPSAAAPPSPASYERPFADVASSSACGPTAAPTPAPTPAPAPAPAAVLVGTAAHARDGLIRNKDNTHEPSSTAVIAHERWPRIWSIAKATILLGAYLGLAMAFSKFEDEWEWTDCVYFAMMTCSTVGYGDISPSPSPAWPRAYTIFLIFLGIGVVFPAVGSALSNVFIAPLTTKGRALLERRFPQRRVDMTGDGVADYTVPRHPLIYYAKNLLPSILLNMLLQAASAGVFCAIEGWDYGSSLYHCLVTATTVGYGDQRIQTPEGKLVASMHMLLAVVMLAEMLSSFDELRTSRTVQLQKVALLRRELDRPLVSRLVERAVALRPKVERDGKGVTELEFVLGMLIELDVVGEDLVQPFVKQFRSLDLTGDGRLGFDDLLVKERSSNPAQLRAMQQAAGSRGSYKLVHLYKATNSGRVLPIAPPVTAE